MGIVEDLVAGRDLAQLIGHAGAARHAVNQAARALEYAGQHPLGGGHLPQDVDVNAARAVRNLMRDARLGNPAIDGVGDQLLVPLAAGPAAVQLRDDAASPS